MSRASPRQTASGRFALIAPAGNAVSAGDFYVPFFSHVPGDIGFTARITPGGSQLVTLGANQIALVLFDGVEGQHVSVGITGSTFSNCTFYLFGPNNPTPNNLSAGCNTGNSFLGPQVLPQ